MSGFLCSSPSRCAWRSLGRHVSRQGSRTQRFASSTWPPSCVDLTRRLPDAWTRHQDKQWMCHAAAARRRTWTVDAIVTPRHDGGRRGFFSPRVIKNYEELPRDYRDQIGLSFGRELSEAQADEIFGRDVGAARANRLLKILHGRRVAGTLEDPAFAVHTAQFDDDEMAVALAYLRKTVPVEEVRNAGLRAEDELEQMELEMQKAAGRKMNASGEEKEGGEEEEEEEFKPDTRYGRSQLDEMRARNLAKARARDKALQEEEEEERKKQQLDLDQSQASVPARREDGSREITNPRVREYYERAQSDLSSPPEMKSWERILPSATVVALVLGFMAAVAAVYEEPAPRYRLFREVTTSQATVGALIAANALVFLGWRVPPLWSLFNRHMILVVATVRPLTLFTAAFSHTRPGHLLVNMVPLWFVGTSLHDEIGRADFLTLYLGCGALGFLAGLATYTLRGWTTVTSLGASGATLGLCSAYFWEHRGDRFRVLGVPEGGVHGIVFLAGLTAVQLAGLGKTVKLRVDIASHLGGIAAGIGGMEMLNRTARGRSRRVR